MPRTVHQTRVGSKQLLGATVPESTAGVWSFGHNCQAGFSRDAGTPFFRLWVDLSIPPMTFPAGCSTREAQDPLLKNSARLCRWRCPGRFSARIVFALLELEVDRGWRLAPAGFKRDAPPPPLVDQRMTSPRERFSAWIWRAVSGQRAG